MGTCALILSNAKNPLKRSPWVYEILRCAQDEQTALRMSGYAVAGTPCVILRRSRRIPRP